MLTERELREVRSCASGWIIFSIDRWKDVFSLILRRKVTEDEARDAIRRLNQPVTDDRP